MEIGEVMQNFSLNYWQTSQKLFGNSEIPKSSYKKIINFSNQDMALKQVDNDIKKKYLCQS